MWQKTVCHVHVGLVILHSSHTKKDGGSSSVLIPTLMSTVQCHVYGQVRGIEWKRLGVWDGWHGHGKMSTRSTEKELIQRLIAKILLTALCGLENCKYSREQLIAALQKQYEYIIHDDYDPEEHISPEESLESYKKMSLEQLIIETDTDEEYTLDDYMADWAPQNPRKK